ncbi:MAG TPA: hypothetical protein VM470_09425 [Acidimicrobiia bacterium]|nr:hypothetical protein [Acidimicrobiia bacterium]
MGKLRVWFLAGTFFMGMGLTTPVLALGGLLDPLVEPLQPITDSAGDLLSPISEPVGEVLEPLTDPVMDTLSPITDPLLEPVEDELLPVTEPLLQPTLEEPATPTTQPPAPQETGSGEDAGPVGATRPEEVAPVAQETEAEAQSPQVRADHPVSGSDQSSGPVGSSVNSGGGSTLLLAATRLLVNPDTTLPTVAPVVSSSLLAAILEWVGRIDAGSVLAAPWLALRVLLRALASAGQGLLAPVTLLIGLATLMAPRERIVGN